MKLVTSSFAGKVHICVDLQFTLCGRIYKSEGKYSDIYDGSLEQVSCNACIKKYNDIKGNPRFRELVAEVTDNQFE